MNGAARVPPPRERDVARLAKVRRTADLDSAERRDPTASHALVVSLEFVRPLVAAEPAQQKGLANREISEQQNQHDANGGARE